MPVLALEEYSERIQKTRRIHRNLGVEIAAAGGVAGTRWWGIQYFAPENIVFVVVVVVGNKALQRMKCSEDEERRMMFVLEAE